MKSETRFLLSSEDAPKVRIDEAGTAYLEVNSTTTVVAMDPLYLRRWLAVATDQLAQLIKAEDLALEWYRREAVATAERLEKRARAELSLLNDPA